MRKLLQVHINTDLCVLYSPFFDGTAGNSFQINIIDLQKGCTLHNKSTEEKPREMSVNIRT